jgi:hypothetical protein
MKKLLVAFPSFAKKPIKQNIRSNNHNQCTCNTALCAADSSWCCGERIVILSGDCVNVVIGGLCGKGIVIPSGDWVNVVIGGLCGKGIVILSGDCVNVVTMGFVWKRDYDTDW